MKTRSLLLSLVAVLLFLSIGGHDAESAISALSDYKGGVFGGSGFTPQSGFAFSGSTAPGGSMTITSSGSVFGSKPFSGQPLLWAPMDSTLNGSTLGRINGASTYSQATSNLVWQSGCGPSGAGGCAYGGTIKGDGNTGGPGVQWGVGLSIDLTSWSGWASQNGGNGYYLNDLGRQFYVWRQEEHVGFGHLDSVSGNSYNSVGNYNVKNIRLYSLYNDGGVSEGYPDIYWPVADQRFEVESCQTPSCFAGVTNGAPVQYVTASTQTSPDVNGSVSVQQSFDGMTTGSGTYNQWAASEFYFQANTQTSGSAAYSGGGAPNSQFWYWVVGKNGNAPIESWPVSNYQNSSPGVGWMFVDSGSLQTNGLGTIARAYIAQYVVDGTSDCPSCSDMPLNAYVNFGPLYADDCWCHIVVQDSATYNSATTREIQIPASWSTGSITLTLRAGTFGNLHGKYLFVIDSANGAHYVGQFTVVFEPHLMNAANDDHFDMREAA
jgi:hypothetical protein